MYLKLPVLHKKRKVKKKSLKRFTLCLSVNSSLPPFDRSPHTNSPAPPRHLPSSSSRLTGCWTLLRSFYKKKDEQKKPPKQIRVSGTYWWWRSRRGRPGSPRWPAPGWWGGPSCGAAAWPTWAAPPPRGQRARRRDTTGTPSTTSLTGRRNIDQTQPEDVQTQCGPNNPDRFLQMSDGRHDSTAKYLL